MKYAAQTSVSVEKSRAEIERTLVRYGATKYAFFSEQTRALIGFEIRLKSYGSVRTNEARLKLWEQACRQRWRALALAIKAKLEWVETGIVTVEEEFLPYIVTASGKTVAEMILPDLQQIYSGGKLPRLLPEHST
jgi:hypothetical protein